MDKTLTVELTPSDLAYIVRLVRYDHGKLTRRYNSGKQQALRQALAEQGRRDAAIVQIEKNEDLQKRLAAVPHG